MDFKSIVYYLDAKGLSAVQIHKELKETFPKDAPGYSTVTKYLREQSFTYAQDAGTENLKKAQHEIIIDAILKALDKQPFASVRELAKLISIPKTVIHDYLVHVMGYQNKHLRWVPHELTSAMKNNRVELAAVLHHKLTKNLNKSRHMVVTLDESWFYLEYLHSAIWVQENQTPPSRARRMISSKKAMLTIVWTKKEIFFVDLLPKGTKFCSNYYLHNILEPLVDIINPPEKRSKTIIHFHQDNARPHTANCIKEFCSENNIKVLPQPPYSPDITPSDFFLFGYIKDKLKGEFFDDENELLHKVEEICNEISPTKLKQVFNTWCTRLEWVANNGGEYCP